MKTTLLSFSLSLFTAFAYAQNSFIGIQNSPRKGMVHASMNPAEINHLHRKVEVNLFAAGATVSNNALTFKDLLEEDDLLNLAFRRIEGTVNLNAEGHVIGPSFGFSVNQWSFGFISQAYVKGDIIDLNSDLGNALSDGHFFSDFNQIRINNSSNQKINASGWTELGLTAGREVWANQEHSISAGGTFKFLVPAAYINMGVAGLQGTLVQDGLEFSLSDAQGQLNISYPLELENQDIEDFMLDRFSLSNISGFAVDLGVAHQWKMNGLTRFSSGLSIKNLGGMSLGSRQANNTYAIHVPQDEAFRLDMLEGDLDEIEDQLLNSGYFTRSRQSAKTRAGLPSLISAYTDVHVSRLFQVSVFGQFRVADKTNNEQLVTQNVFAVTPRLTLGIFEIYSPWSHYEVSGLTGGLGLRLGGFFVGSQSVLTGLIADTKQADIHMGFSMGFGERGHQ